MYRLEGGSAGGPSTCKHSSINACRSGQPRGEPIAEVSTALQLQVHRAGSTSSRVGYWSEVCVLGVSGGARSTIGRKLISRAQSDSRGDELEARRGDEARVGRGTTCHKQHE